MNDIASFAGAKLVGNFVAPRSIAIIGASSGGGGAGWTVLRGLESNNYDGEVFLVGRSAGSVGGRDVFGSVDELPHGIDLAVLAVPAGAVGPALEACGHRGVSTAMIFAAGFAEQGSVSEQEAIEAAARAAGIGLVGPNCLGFTNNVDGLSVHMISPRVAERAVTGGVAFVGQSGGILGHFQRAALGIALPVSYVISTGNEAGLDSTDFLEFLAEDAATSVVVLYTEHIRRPAEFLAAIRRCRAAGKPVVLMQAGRGAKARKAAQSHTGALVDDLATIRVHVEAAGGILLSTMDAVMDLVQILARFPDPPALGPGIITASGAYVAVANDFAEELGLDLPQLEPETVETVRAALPSFGNYGNPLDLTAGHSAEALPLATKAMLDDPNVGSLLVSYPIGNPAVVNGFNAGMADSPKATIMVALGDSMPLDDRVMEEVRKSPAVFSRSSDRMFRAIAEYTRYGQLLSRRAAPEDVGRVDGLRTLDPGVLPEWLGKQILSGIGIPTPAGGLARTSDAAVEMAERVGYPVAVKAQAAGLAHKTEAGGVKLALGDEASVRAAWDEIESSLGAVSSDLALEGCLVERMESGGLELVVGAHRDSRWGPVLMVGIGGIWVEALRDVQLLPVDADGDQVRRALRGLRSAKLLEGYRGTPPADVDAITDAVLALGALMRARSDILEVDVNPLAARAEGGVIALDALISVE